MRAAIRKTIWCGILTGALILGAAGCGQKEAEQNVPPKQTSIAESIAETTKAAEEKNGTETAKAAENQETEVLADYRAIVEEYAGLILPVDEDKYLYDCAIEAVGKYIAGEESLENAKRAVDNAVQELTDRQSKIEDYEVSEDMIRLMTEYGILPEEMEAFGNFRKTNLTSALVDLKTLYEHMEHAEEFDFEYEDVVFWHDFYKAVRESENGYYYYACVNYWFSEWEEEQVAYVKEQVMDHFKSYDPNLYVWETDKEVIEQKVMRYLDVVEEYNNLAAEHEAEAKEDLYEMRQYHEKLQELVKKQQELNEMENELEQMKDIQARLEEVSKQIEQAKNDGNEERLAELKVEFEAIVAEYENLVAEHETEAKEDPYEMRRSSSKVTLDLRRQELRKAVAAEYDNLAAEHETKAEKVAEEDLYESLQELGQELHQELNEREIKLN